MKDEKVTQLKPDDHLTAEDSAGSSVVPSFAQAEAGKGGPKAIRDEIRAACRQAPIWDAMVKYLTPPGICGSRQFDHANAIRELLDWDSRRNDKRIAAYGIPPFLLWRHLYAVLKQVYEAKGGRILGQIGYDKEDGPVI